MKKLSEGLGNVGVVLILLGGISFILSFFNLQFKALSFLGENRSGFEIACIVIGVLLFIISSLISKNDKNDESKKENEA